MMVGMLVAGIGLVLVGLLAIGYGISIQEFSVGNTLILTGVIGVCSGAILLGLWTAVRELRNIAQRLGAGVPEPRSEAAVGDGGLLFSRDRQVVEKAAGAEPAAASAPPSPPPWQDAARDRPRGDAPPEAAPAEAASAAKAKRNLLFSSTSRKERERAQARTSEALPMDLLSADLRPDPPALPPLPPEAAETPPASFDDAWPKSEGPRPGDLPPPRRAPPTPSTFNETNGTSARTEEQPAVTVLKSGVVDGMAYSLFSDGSIEAQMPEGMMRFASIEELRAHLDHRP
jgi:hypothetical protein